LVVDDTGEAAEVIAVGGPVLLDMATPEAEMVRR